MNGRSRLSQTSRTLALGVSLSALLQLAPAADAQAPAQAGGGGFGNSGVVLHTVPAAEVQAGHPSD